MRKKNFWLPNRILSYQRIWMFIMGNRSAGKTYGTKKYCVKRFIEKGEQFIWLKRYDDDIPLTAPHFFNDIGIEFEGHDLQYRNKQFLIDGKVAGFALCLSQATKTKGNSLPDVWNIIFDEFLNEDGKYLKDEVDACFRLYQTIARGKGQRIREVKMFFISNSLSTINPYFEVLGIFERLKNIKERNFVIKSDSWVVEMFVNEEAVDEIRNSQFGKLINGSKYADMANNNEFYLDNLNFIDKMPEKAQFKCSIIYNEQTFGVWYDRNNTVYYINKKIDPTNEIIYSLDNLSHNTSTILISKRSNFYKTMRECYECGGVKFSDLQAKNAFLVFLGLSS